MMEPGAQHCGRRLSALIRSVTVTTAAIVISITSIFFISGALSRTKTLADDSANGQNLTAPIPSFEDKMVDWRILPSFDVEFVLTEQVEQWLEATERETIQENCLQWIHTNDRWILGHVILIRLFGLAEYCTEFRDEAFVVHLHGLTVAIQTEQGTFRQTVKSVPDPAEQRENIVRYWDLLEHHGAEKVAKFRPPIVTNHKWPETRSPDPTKVQQLVDALLQKGPRWVPVGLGSPSPDFDAESMDLLKLYKREASEACIKGLLQDDSWESAHLILCSLHATRTRTHEEWINNQCHLVIDGLTIDINVEPKEPRIRPVYSHTEFEKHFLRHRWLVRTKKMSL